MARLNQTSRNRDADSAPVRTIKPQQAAAQNGLRSAVKVSGLALLGALLAGCLVYSPALSGPFVFDDFVLPFRLPDFRGETLREWMASVRPLLMLSYWFNYQWSGRESTFSYHLLTVLIHSVNTVLVGAVLWRILQWTNARRGRRQLLTAVGAGAFLLHPLQSESVAYIAGRSESLSALWCLAAWATMLYRPTDVLSWRRVLAILLFFGAALATKEHTVALAGVLLLTDAFAAGTSFLAAVRRNWRLYAPLAAGAVVGG
ncbi:MAG TPA: hypothetical protein VES20_17265, partial [Bryobacteraceae bacterium]|nr:hypothetical protein [Bryobacteraceae bacterium]